MPEDQKPTAEPTADSKSNRKRIAALKDEPAAPASPPSPDLLRQHTLQILREVAGWLDVRGGPVIAGEFRRHFLQGPEK